VVGYAAAQGKSGVLGLAPNGNAVTGISDNATGVCGIGKSFGAGLAPARAAKACMRTAMQANSNLGEK
jgi:hypothetical protein